MKQISFVLGYWLETLSHRLRPGGNEFEKVKKPLLHINRY